MWVPEYIAGSSDDGSPLKRQLKGPPGRTTMYGPYVRDKFPARKHLNSIIDIEIDHHHARRHLFAWLVTLAAVAGAAAWAWHAGYLPH
jgi:hypothetical protein